VIARRQGRGLAEVAAEAGAAGSVVDVVGDEPTKKSPKAVLDLGDWDDQDQRTRALVRALEALDAFEEWLEHEEGGVVWEAPGVLASIEVARRVREQDVKEAPGGEPRPS